MIQQIFEFSPTPQPAVPLLRTAGELAKERGMQLAADARPDAVAAGQVAFLLALLKSPDGTATIEDGDRDLAATFGDGGKWRGAVVSGLARRRIIGRVAVELSDRPSRHRGLVSRWRLLNCSKAQRELERLLVWLTPKENPLAAATAAGIESTTTTPKRKESSDAVI